MVFSFFFLYFISCSCSNMFLYFHNSQLGFKYVILNEILNMKFRSGSSNYFDWCIIVCTISTSCSHASFVVCIMYFRVSLKILTYQFKKKSFSSFLYKTLHQYYCYILSTSILLIL
uniref:Uncharacterized protein n=1 Tax=Cacopsylla melanoneura TaxID=428564 RepID=A0A8D9DVG8_9HEMI